MEALDLDHARQVIAPRQPGERTRRVDHETHARDYLRLAIGKILDHRSSSASRSVDKLSELAWLLGRDDVVAAMGHAGYPMYGAPAVKAFAGGFGWPFHDDLDGATGWLWPGWRRDSSAIRRAANGAAPTDRDPAASTPSRCHGAHVGSWRSRNPAPAHPFDLIDWPGGGSIVGADTARAASTPTSTYQRRPEVSP
ncbi:hypothetical protein ABZ949_31815 [Micromonospora tulbaghiae]|uniref:hypothetical protein n=1 Tax=Micromonospora tulbaghiae TaxID=479978 RepID=UPI0033DC5F8D